MKLQVGKFVITIRMTVVLVLTLVTALTAALAIGLQYHFSRNLAREATAELFSQAAAGIAAELGNFGSNNASVIRLLADNPDLLRSLDEMAILRVFADVLDANPLLYGIYIGRADGGLLELVNLGSKAGVRRIHSALPSDRWLVISVSQQLDHAVRTFRYYDADFQLRTSRNEESSFDVRTRNWYRDALANPEVQRSDVYLFDQLGAPGRTVSQRVQGTDMVVALDYTLNTMSRWLDEQAVARLGEVFVFRPDGMVAASTLQAGKETGRPVAPQLPLSEAERAVVARYSPLRVSNQLDWPPFDYALYGQPRGYSVDVANLVGDLLGLKIDFVNGYSWPELIQRFRAGDLDLLLSARLEGKDTDLGLASDSYFRLPYALVTRPGSEPIQTLDQLRGQRLAVPAGSPAIPLVREHYPEIELQEKPSSLQALQAVRDRMADAALDSEATFRYISQHYFLNGLEFHSGVSLGKAAPPDQLRMLLNPSREALLPLINRALAALTPAHREQLYQRWLRYDSDQRQGSAGVVPHDTMITIAQSPERQGTLEPITYLGEPYYVFVSPTTGQDGQLLFGVMVSRASVVGPFLEKVKLATWITTGFLLLLLPLSWALASPIVSPVKQLAQETDKVRLRQYNKVARVRSRIRELNQLSDSMVHMVRAIQSHEQAQRDLIDSIIRLIAEAIDEKSPYTGGHCERVPELALMLVKCASSSNLPAFQDFKLENEDQWREFRIAAWLHDCGKITTPEHVVDKGSKLETIYNRIHEVRTRFEVLWRDAEIDFLRQCRAEPAAELQHRRDLAQTRQRLQDDFAFVARCNVGGEYLSPEDQQRLGDIAGHTWQRHFDDRLGLSPVEELRVMNLPHRALPATEYLLADRPEHIIERSRSTDYPPEYGINMEIPKHLYNQGELYNLSISRGTLTEEDRFKINEHMISTIKMLESLPFPEELRRVPRYASTHHETMKGTGYPRKLPGSALSIPERLLAVADVFEALTAADRPYKKAKPISEAVEILYRMVEDNHIDRDSFELFLREKVYLQYAARFLAPEQIDEVDLERYLGSAA